MEIVTEKICEERIDGREYSLFRQRISGSDSFLICILDGDGLVAETVAQEGAARELFCRAVRLCLPSCHLCDAAEDYKKCIKNQMF